MSVKPSITRLVIVNILMVSLLTVVATTATVNAAAADLSGSWGSYIEGHGLMQSSLVADYNYDIRLELTQAGNSVSGTIETTCTNSANKPGYESWGTIPVGQKNTYAVSGTVSGSNLTLACHVPAQSGISNGIGWSSDAYDITWVLKQDGARLGGSGTYQAAGITYAYTFDLVAGNGAMEGLLSDPMVFSLIVGAVVIACLVPAILVLKKRTAKGPGSVQSGPSSMQGGQGGETGGSGKPEAGVPVGGVGLHNPVNYVDGRPVSPRQWRSQQPGPNCPVHGTACKPVYKSAEDQGEWLCPTCQELGRPAFPWGKP